MVLGSSHVSETTRVRFLAPTKFLLCYIKINELKGFNVFYIYFSSLARLIKNLLYSTFLVALGLERITEM